MSDLTKLTIAETRDGLKKRDFTATEVVSAYIKAMESNRQYNAYVLETPEIALEQAKASDRRYADGTNGALEGIPLGIKDLFCTKGIRTTACSHILDGFVPQYESTVTGKLLSAGAAVLGKLNMDEFAMGASGENSAYGVTRNPNAPDHIPGGSSGGSAAAVASATAIAALGSDTGGSIRQPAGHCGIVGLKPTYGRVSRYGLVAFASSLDQIGPMTRTVEDAAILLQAISGHDPKDSTSADEPVPDFEAALGRDVKGLKVGIPAEYFTSGNHPGISEAVQNTVKQLESLGAELVEISLPHADAVVAAYYIIACAEASSNLSRFDGVRYGKRAEDAAGLVELFSRTREEGFGPEVKRRIILGTYVLSSGYYDAYYSRAQKVRSLVARDFAEAFSRADIIVGPTSPAPAPKIGDSALDHLQTYLADIYTIPANLAGLPAMSIPCGTVKEGGMELPVGFQMTAPHFREDLLLKTGFALGK